MPRTRASRPSRAQVAATQDSDSDSDGEPAAPRQTRYTLHPQSQPPVPIPAMLHPLTLGGKRSLSILLEQTCPPGMLRKHLEQAAEMVSDAVGNLNDRLVEQERQETIKTGKLADRIEKTPATEETMLADLNDRLEANKKRLEQLAELRSRVDGMTEEMDGQVQGLTDSYRLLRHLQAARMSAEGASTRANFLADPSDRLSGVPSSFNISTTQPGNTQPPGSHVLDGPTGVGSIVVQPCVEMSTKLDELIAADESTSKEMLYGEDEVYKNFRAVTHDARNPANDDGAAPAMPPTRLWFTSSGRSTVVRADEAGGDDGDADGAEGGGADADGGDDDDSDLEIEVQAIKTSLKCPLTMQTLATPLTNRECGHSYESHAIKEMLRSTRSAVRCPAANCSKFVHAQSLHSDPLLLRKLARHRQREAQEADRDGDDDDGNGDGDAGPGGTQSDWAYV